ncbi:hypothetical protein INR49_005095 [Caranx melampygus]|nr:hypothetical protein INR49_005095 [Caranx melampygus]
MSLHVESVFGLVPPEQKLTVLTSVPSVSMAKIDGGTVTKCNFAGDEKAGASWTDKIMANKSDTGGSEKTGGEGEGAEEDEWESFLGDCSTGRVDGDNWITVLIGPGAHHLGNVFHRTLILVYSLQMVLLVSVVIAVGLEHNYTTTVAYADPFVENSLIHGVSQHPQHSASL